MTTLDRSSRTSVMAAIALTACMSYAGSASAQPTPAPAPSEQPAPAPSQPPIAGGQPTTIVVQQQPSNQPVYDNMRSDWSPGQPVPQGYHPSKEPLMPLVIAGASVLGSTWLLFGVLPGAIIIGTCDVADSVGGSCGHVQAAGGTLLIPAVGPFVSMGIFAANDNLGGAGAGILVVDGLVQCGGLAMLIAGLAVQHDILVRDKVGGIDVQMTPAPMQIGDSGVGLGLVGAF